MPKKTRKPRSPRRCTYCGVLEDPAGPEFDKDHVLPKALFNVLDPQMITVRSCPNCQLEKKAGDEDLRDYVNDHPAGSLHPEAGPQREKIQRAIFRGQSRLGRELLTTRELREVITEEGLHVWRWGTPISERHRAMFRTLEYIVRGLYSHTTRIALPPECPVAVKAVEDRETLAPLARLPHRGPTMKGKGVVWWVSSHAGDDPLSTYWVLLFNDAVWFLSGTGQFALGDDEAG